MGCCTGSPLHDYLLSLNIDSKSSKHLVNTVCETIYSVLNRLEFLDEQEIERVLNRRLFDSYLSQIGDLKNALQGYGSLLFNIDMYYYNNF